MPTRRMPTRRRSRSSGRHINSPPLTQPRDITRGSTSQSGATNQNGTRGRSGTRGQSGTRGRSGTRGKNGSNGKTNKKNNVVPLARLLNPVKGKKIKRYRNPLLQTGNIHATEVRTPGGTVVANYHKNTSHRDLPEYPNLNSSFESYNSNSNSYSSQESNEPTSAEMRRNAIIDYATRMINNPLHPVRSGSANRPEYNTGAYRTGQNPLGRRESF
jgi:hypothetical protein